MTRRQAAPPFNAKHARHCEQSEAIQGFWRTWIATAFGLAMTARFHAMG